MPLTFLLKLIISIIHLSTFEESFGRDGREYVNDASSSSSSFEFSQGSYGSAEQSLNSMSIVVMSVYIEKNKDKSFKDAI